MVSNLTEDQIDIVMGISDIKLNQYERKVFSQNGEDGIILEIIRRIYNNHTNKYFVEFGVQNGAECNTRLLREQYGWNGLMMDAGYENHKINLYKEYITKDNIINLFEKYNVPKYFNLLCIDIDYNDFHVLNEILKQYCADIVILEYNASFVPFIDAVVKYDENQTWDGSNYFGASLSAFTSLLNHYNHSLVYTERMGVNAFYINNNILKKYTTELFTNINNVDILYNTPKYGRGPLGGHPQDSLLRRYITSRDIISCQ